MFLAKIITEFLFNTLKNNNATGLYILGSTNNLITKNNFIDNRYWSNDFIYERYWGNAYFYIKPSDFLNQNKWEKNYWSDYNGFGPKIIRGEIEKIMYLNFLWWNIDWSPAKTPYEI